jgi:hypothetical protein
MDRHELLSKKYMGLQSKKWKLNIIGMTNL